MAFFDEIGKKISLTGQSAVQKTKDMTEIARLSSIISDEEKKCSRIYDEIGRLYMKLHADDNEEDFIDYIRKIQESEERILVCRRQIRSIKGVVHCKHCGAEVSLSSTFCSACGSKVEIVNEDNKTIKCENCGKAVSKGLKFCTGCGAKLIKGDIENDASSLSAQENSAQEKCGTEENEPLLEKVADVDINKKPEIAKSEQQKDLNKRQCPACGNIQKAALKFCIECGSKMGTEESESISFAKEEGTLTVVANQSELKKNEGSEDSIERQCQACGHVQNVAFKFCTESGSKMENEKTESKSISFVKEASLIGVSNNQPGNSSHIGKDVSENTDDEDSATVMLMPDVDVPQIIPYLVYKKNNEKIMINKAVFRLGRDKVTNDYVIVGNKYVGHNHCHIITRGEEYFIVDDNSKNRTFIDGVMISPGSEVKLTQGQILKLANEEFEFKIF